MGGAKSISSGQVQTAIDRLAEAIAARHDPSRKIWLLGIANGGIALAHRLAARLNAKKAWAVPGTLDISFHRDDLGRHPVPKEFSPTDLPGDVTDATVILVDDVLYTGRTIKASLDELFDHGRPGRVELAVLVDRGGRRLPVSPDYVGLFVSAEKDETVVVSLDNDRPEQDRVRILRGSK